MSAIVRATPPWAWANAWQRVAAVSLFALGLFLPFSTAGVSLFSLALLTLLLLRPAVLWQSRPWREPVLVAGLALLAWITLHTLWRSGWTAESGSTINRFHELLGGPLLYALLGDERRRRMLLTGFVTGLAGLAIAYWVARLAPQVAPELSGNLHPRRISAGFALSVGAFLLAVQAQTRRSVPAAVLSLVFAATVLFAIDGRTGHIVLLVLAGMTAWSLSPKRLRWTLAVAMPAVVLVVGVLLSSSVNTRLQETLAGAGPDANGNFSSTAIRIEFARLALDLVRQHGLSGAGYARYSTIHEAAAHARYGADPSTASWLAQEWVRTPNPHNEYVMQLVGGGIVAFGLFLAWLALAARRAWQSAGPAGTMLAGTVLAYALAALFNSVLMDFIEGHIYMALLPLLLAASRAAGEQTS